MLRPYQEEASEFLLDNKGAALFLSPGLGKTLITLQTLSRLRLRGLGRTLVIAPIRVIYNVWPQELKKWDFNMTCSILHGAKKTEALKGSADIHLINPEGLKWLFNQELPEYDVLVVDESSMFKNPSSKRFKMMKKELKRFKRRYILTGTPTPRSLQDLWSQVYILDKGERLGQYITHYREAYFYPIRRGEYFDWGLIPGMDKIIHAKIAPIAYRIDEADHIDLPELLFNDIEVELPKAIQKFYKGIEKDLWAELDGKDHFADTAAGAYLKCCQVASGAMYTDEGVQVIHNEKVEALKELVGELNGKPLLVAYRFKHELDRLREVFPEARAIHGGSTQAEDTETILQWNTGKCVLLLAQAQTISHGLNLQEGKCADVVWFSLTDDFEVYEQLYRRIYRSGNKANKVRVHHIVARNTVDRAIQKRLCAKNDRQVSLFEALKEYRNDRD